jgi:GNAT superfamily N-acetyltransferase
VPSLTLDRVTYADPAVVALTAEVQDYYRQIYGGPDDSPLADEELVPPAGLFLLARLDGEPVGMGGWRKVTDVEALSGEQPAELRRMYTAPAARHRGVGRAPGRRDGPVDGRDPDGRGRLLPRLRLRRHRSVRSLGGRARHRLPRPASGGLNVTTLSGSVVGHSWLKAV